MHALAAQGQRRVEDAQLEAGPGGQPEETAGPGGRLEGIAGPDERLLSSCCASGPQYRWSRV